MEKEQPNNYSEIELALIDPPSTADRLEINPDGLKELADSISQIGLLQPILLAEKGGRFEIIYGHRRFLAHKSLGRLTIPAKTVDYSEKQASVARATENLQREDLTPIEEAHTYLRLIDELGLPLDETARLCGKTPGVIKRRVMLLKLPEKMRNALHARKLSIAVAEELGSCSDPSHQDYLVDMAIEHGITRNIAKQWVQDYKKSLRGNPEAVGGVGGEPLDLGPQKVYGTCETCQGAVDVAEAKYLRLCLVCWKTVMANLGPE